MKMFRLNKFREHGFHHGVMPLPSSREIERIYRPLIDDLLATARSVLHQQDVQLPIETLRGQTNNLFQAVNKFMNAKFRSLDNI